MSASERTPQRRRVEANLIEATPGLEGAGHWILASPLLLFMLWIWLDTFDYYSALPSVVDWLLATLIFAMLFVLPLGLAAFWVVTSLPRLFHHAGWNVEPLTHVALAEQYTVRYEFQKRIRAPFSIRRLLVRAAQGWVYLEITTILVGAVVMVPLFFSAVEFGFGR